MTATETIIYRCDFCKAKTETPDLLGWYKVNNSHHSCGVCALQVQRILTILNVNHDFESVQDGKDCMGKIIIKVTNKWNRAVGMAG